MDIKAAMAANLASLQSAISRVILDKSISAHGASASTMIADFKQANPDTPPVSFGHRLDSRA